MDVDFMTFQINLLLTLKQEAPPDENFRAVMAPALSRIRNYSGAEVAIHTFVSPDKHELDTMVIGTSDSTRQALDKELLRRHGEERLTAESQLPAYSRIALRLSINILNLLSPSGEVCADQASEEMVRLLKEMHRLFPEEFSEPLITEGDTLIFIPLGTGDYRHLGCIILWAQSNALAECIAQPIKLNGLVEFRKGMERLLIRLFTGFYQMEPQTYLPSSWRIEQKPVALLCAEIRNFTRISEILRQHHDFERREAAECLRKLVSCFLRTVAEVVNGLGGRVNQIWGNGLLAVFGEQAAADGYLDTPESNHRVSCKRAVWAAQDIVEKFREVSESWLRNDFCIERFMRFNNEEVIIEPAVAVDFGEVIFDYDYAGIQRNREYLAIGDHVSFVRQLAGVASRIDLDSGNPASPKLAPILLSQTAYTWSRDILCDLPGTPMGTVHQARTVRLPGKPTFYPVYEVRPGNVVTTAP